jgi:hypothetical protein
MRYLTRDQIDSTKWDRCVGYSFNSMVYGLSWYLDLMADNWSALVWGDYEAVMPLPYRSKYGFHYLYQPPFTQQFGVFSLTPIDTARINDFIQSIPSHYRYVDLNLNKECLSYTGREKLIPRNNFILDLNASYETLRKKFSANSRMNIKRTERPEASAMKLGEVKDLRTVIHLFAENQIKYSNRFTSADYNKLLALVDYCLPLNTIEMVGVYDSNDEVCAASVLLTYKNRRISIFSGSNQMARKEKAMFFLFDRWIKEHAGQNLILDFAGSNDPGLANFYSGFASANEVYPKLKYNHLPWPLNIIKK